MLQGGSTFAALVGLGAWLVLAFLGAVRALGEGGGDVTRGCLLVAIPVALAAAARAFAAYWRGPDIISFTRSDSEPCTPCEAAYVRARASIRGTMGGAGYLYPRRLALPAVAWVAAAIAGMGALSQAVDEAVGAWPVFVTFVAATIAAFVLPARPYYYRDTAGGGAIVSPPPAAQRLKRNAALAAAVARGETVETVTPSPADTPRLGASAAPRDPA